MSERPQSDGDATNAADSRTAKPDAAATMTLPKRWALQFGLLELHGLLVSIAVWYFLLIGLLHNPIRPYRRYGSPPPMPSAPIDLRVRAFLMGTLASLGGSYLSCRVATERHIRGIWQRLVNQAFYSFIVVPVLVCVAILSMFLCTVPFQ